MEPAGDPTGPSTNVGGGSSSVADVLTALTPGQRDVLRLLAEGHTAKSIALATGLSAAAVNERLRAARRSTGVASSRELARKLRSQEIRDEKIELPGSRPPGIQIDTSKAPTIRRPIVPLTILTVAAAATLAMQGSTPPREAAVLPHSTDPLLGSLAEERGTVADFHRLVRREPRDPLWASSTEATLVARYGRIDGWRNIASIRVSCATSVCEVAAALPARGSRRIMSELQGEALRGELEADGLSLQAMGFSGEAFVAYVTRRR